jgi:hypothetical protein
MRRDDVLHHAHCARVDTLTKHAFSSALAGAVMALPGSSRCEAARVQADAQNRAATRRADFWEWHRRDRDPVVDAFRSNGSF